MFLLNLVRINSFLFSKPPFFPFPSLLKLQPPPPHVRWSDGMRYCRSDWPGLCLFCCYYPRVLTANRVDLGFFVSCNQFVISTFSPIFFIDPPSAANTHLSKATLSKRFRRHYDPSSGALSLLGGCGVGFNFYIILLSWYVWRLVV